jgi:hypothetical protein
VIKITPTSGAYESLSSSTQAKVRHLVEDIRWYLKFGSDLSAYKVIFPQKTQRKNVETVVAIWSKLDSKERSRLKKVGEEREHG